ncbi:MAG: alpha-mannosidase, partial [Clostridia bacterium]|nr:alpha-mannosidase [Clostridia bacterium]
EIAAVYDKENDRQVLTGTGNALTVFIDKCVHETAWNLEKNYQKKYWDLDTADSIEVAEQNAVRGVVRVRRTFHKSTITQDIVLYAGSREVRFETTVDWHESDKVLKAAFPVNVMDTQASFEIAHGAIRRPTHRNTSYDAAKFEQCAHKWADLSEGDYGVSILNDCKYGYDIHNSRMRITLMRAPTCPDRTGDHGINTFVYAYYPHKFSWQQAQTVENGVMLNMPPLTALVGEQDGALESGARFVEVSADSLTVECFKPAQDGKGYILRLAEQKHGRGKATVTFFRPFRSVTECNMIEENEETLAKNAESFSFSFRPYEVKTFRIVF